MRPLDACVVRVFLRLLTQDQRLVHAWHLTEETSADVWLIGSEVTLSSTTSSTQIRIVPAEAAAPGAGQRYLRCPLQLEDFIDVLNAITQPAPEAEPEDSMDPQLLARQINVDLGTRLRLQRWPTAHALAARSEFRRLAAFLSARYLTMQELAVHSQVDWSVCVEFLHAMHALGLLERQGSNATPAPHSTAMPMPPKTLSVRPQATTAVTASPHEVPSRVLGMLQRLRGRLGLAAHGGHAAHAG